MNRETAERLCQLNTSFYQSQYESFAQTRARPWQGWNTCLEHIKGLLPSDSGEFSISSTSSESGDSCDSGDPGDPGSSGDSGGFGKKALSVLDLACGNLRFEVFLESSLPESTFTFYAVDNCDGLVSEEPQVMFQNLDIIKGLQGERSLVEQLDAPVCDLSVAFGFLHHIPQREQREEVLRSLITKTRPGGLVMVTFWQFLKDSGYAEKAFAEHQQGVSELGFTDTDLEEGDILLGWTSTPGVYRYCHSFSEEEIDELVAALAGQVRVRDRFTADGRADSANAYLVFEVL
jgi:SAM-dependent methyltransferase